MCTVGAILSKQHFFFFQNHSGYILDGLFTYLKIKYSNLLHWYVGSNLLCFEVFPNTQMTQIKLPKESFLKNTISTTRLHQRHFLDIVTVYCLASNFIL